MKLIATLDHRVNVYAPETVDEFRDESDLNQILRIALTWGWNVSHISTNRRYFELRQYKTNRYLNVTFGVNEQLTRTAFGSKDGHREPKADKRHLTIARLTHSEGI